jgi:argininosuccinate lyase
MTEYTTHHFKATSRYSVSIDYDRRLFPHDIAGSIAHARMLAKQNIITSAEGEALVRGLEAIRQEIEAGSFQWREELEDTHMNIERRLFDLEGEVAGKLHTARSRNDQVTTAVRLFTREAISEATVGLQKLQAALVAQAEQHQATLIPGYTHLQRAQPVLLAHHFLAYFEMFDRDAARLADCRRRVNVLPLGSGALAGVPYPIDREAVAQELGFDSVSANSMDAVSDRDYVVEFISAAATCMMHCSRLAEELVIWSSPEFGFVKLAEEWTTGSSIMPQKRNPDFAELARGKTGRVYGSLISVLTTLKGLPLTYNRDLQEDKEPLFDATDTLHGTLEVLAGMIESVTVNTDRVTAAASDSSLLATDLADYLVGKGIAFREAHSIVGRLCQDTAGQGRALSDLSLVDFKGYSASFDDSVLNITAASSVAARNVPGGTAPSQVKQALADAKRRMKEATSGQ